MRCDGSEPSDTCIHMYLYQVPTTTTTEKSLMCCIMISWYFSFWFIGIPIFKPTMNIDDEIDSMMVVREEKCLFSENQKRKRFFSVLAYLLVNITNTNNKLSFLFSLDFECLSIHGKCWWNIFTPTRQMLPVVCNVVFQCCKYIYLFEPIHSFIHSMTICLIYCCCNNNKNNDTNNNSQQWWWMNWIELNRILDEYWNITNNKKKNIKQDAWIIINNKKLLKMHYTSSYPLGSFLILVHSFIHLIQISQEIVATILLWWF